MTKTELVGYARKNVSGNALRIKILKAALDTADVEIGMNGEEYVILIMNLSKIKMVIGDGQEVTSVCQVIEHQDEGGK